MQLTVMIPDRTRSRENLVDDHPALQIDFRTKPFFSFFIYLRLTSDSLTASAYLSGRYMNRTWREQCQQLDMCAELLEIILRPSGPSPRDRESQNSIGPLHASHALAKLRGESGAGGEGRKQPLLFNPVDCRHWLHLSKLTFLEWGLPSPSSPLSLPLYLYRHTHTYT